MRCLLFCDLDFCLTEALLSHTYFFPFFLSFSTDILRSKRPHGSLPREHYASFYNQLVANKFDVTNHLHYLVSSQSHIFPQHITVINVGSSSFSQLEDMFDQLDFTTSLAMAGASLAPGLSAPADGQKPSEARGNKQVSAGFTGGQSLNSRCPSTGVPQPAMFTGTAAHKLAFEVLSALASEAAKLSIGCTDDFVMREPFASSVQLAFRHAKFAAKISCHNNIEYMAHCVTDKNNPIVFAHTDTKNDRDPGHSTVITAARLLVDTNTTPPELKRVVQIGTQRKACGDFMKRINDCGAIIERLKVFYASLSPCNRGFDPNIFFTETVGQTGFIEGSCLLAPANADRCVMESAYAFAAKHFIEHGNPVSRSEVYEVVMCCAWFREPYKFLWCVEK